MVGPYDYTLSPVVVRVLVSIQLAYCAINANLLSRDHRGFGCWGLYTSHSICDILLELENVTYSFSPEKAFLTISLFALLPLPSPSCIVSPTFRIFLS